MKYNVPLPIRLKSKNKIISYDYVKLEDAINIVGENTYPLEWGRLLGWSQMPFRYMPRKKSYVQHNFVIRGQRAVLESSPIKLKTNKPNKSACVAIYRNVRNILQQALIDGHLQASAIHDRTGESSAIKVDHVWTKQAYPIFFTGRMAIINPPDPDMLADVVINRDSLRKWIKKREDTTKKDFAVAALHQIGSILLDHSTKHDYRVKPDMAYEILRTEADKVKLKLSRRRFNETIWKAQGKRAGAPLKIQKDRFEMFRIELIRLIAAELDGRYGNGK